MGLATYELHLMKPFIHFPISQNHPFNLSTMNPARHNHPNRSVSGILTRVDPVSVSAVIVARRTVTEAAAIGWLPVAEAPFAEACLPAALSTARACTQPDSEGSQTEKAAITQSQN